METRTKIILGIIVLIVGGVFVFAWFRGGATGIFSIVSTVIRIIFWLAVIGAVVAIVYFLFIFQKRIDAKLEVSKDIIRETKINRVSNIKDLWTTGDSEHIPLKIGKIIGYSKRQNYATYTIGEKTDAKEYYYDESIFRVRRRFENPLLDLLGGLMKKVIIRCPTVLHDRLQGDVYMHCVALVKHGHYFYPNVLHNRFDAIDKTIYNEALRYTNLDVIRLAHPLIMKGMGVTPADKKELESATGFQLIRGNMQPQGQGGK